MVSQKKSRPFLVFGSFGHPLITSTYTAAKFVVLPVHRVRAEDAHSEIFRMSLTALAKAKSRRSFQVLRHDLEDLTGTVGIQDDGLKIGAAPELLH